MSTYEEAVRKMKEDGRASGLIGGGEILDEGRLGKRTLREMMERHIAECTLENLKKAADEWSSFFSGEVEAPTEEEVERRRAEIRAKYEALIAAAPEEDEHDWVYHA